MAQALSLPPKNLGTPLDVARTGQSGLERGDASAIAADGLTKTTWPPLLGMWRAI
jgi:hypothetical protein